MLACHLEYNPIVAYRAYEEIAGLSPDMLRHLLHHGDAVERVWAAWAIGAALGAQSAADLLVSLRESPVAGTRRHLLVVLAGLGEQSVLRVFAQDDPDEYVRATACRYLIRIDGHANAFIRERLLQDPSPNVRLTILDEAPAAYPSVQFDELSLLVRDTQLEVRQAATERLLATSPLMELFPGAL